MRKDKEAGTKICCLCVSRTHIAHTCMMCMSDRQDVIALNSASAGRCQGSDTAIHEPHAGYLACDLCRYPTTRSGRFQQHHSSSR